MKIVRSAVAIVLVLTMLCLPGCNASMSTSFDANYFSGFNSVILLEDSVLLFPIIHSVSSEDEPPVHLKRLHFDGRLEEVGTIQAPGLPWNALVGNTFYMGTSTWRGGNKLHALDLTTNELTEEDLGEDSIVCLEAFGDYLIRGRSHHISTRKSNTYLEMYDPETSTVVKTFDINSVVSNFYRLRDLCADGEFLYVLSKEYYSEVATAASILKLNQDLELVGSLDISVATELVSPDIRRFEVYGDFIYIVFDGSRTCVAGTLEDDVLVRPEAFKSLYPFFQYDASSPVFWCHGTNELFFINETTNTLESKPFSLEDRYTPSSVLKNGDRIAIFAEPSKESTTRTGSKCFITDRELTGLAE